MIHAYDIQSVIKLVDVLPPRSPDNARDKGAAVAAHSEAIERASSPITAQPDEVVGKQVSSIHGS